MKKSAASNISGITLQTYLVNRHHSLFHIFQRGDGLRQGCKHDKRRFHQFSILTQNVQHSSSAATFNALNRKIFDCLPCIKRQISNENAEAFSTTSAALRRAAPAPGATSVSHNEFNWYKNNVAQGLNWEQELGGPPNFLSLCWPKSNRKSSLSQFNPFIPIPTCQTKHQPQR